MLKSSLPSFVGFGSLGPEDSWDGVASRKYLGYVSPGGAYDVQFYFRFSVQEAVAKFALVPAKSGEAGLVNVRCCYNNKYWSRPHPNVTTIVAEESEPVEDKSSYKCTLFKPTLVDYEGKPGVQFLHVETGRYLVLSWSNLKHYQFVMVAQSDSDKPLTFILADYDSLAFLPKRVMFRGNNEKFLKPMNPTSNFLQFSEVDPGSEWVAHDVFTTSDGQVQIKNTRLGKYWRRSTDNESDWVLADVEKVKGDLTDDPNTLFGVVKISNQGVVTLQSVGNNHFCKRLTYGNQQDCLNASAVNLIEDGKLEVHEPVVSRVVREVKFNLDAAIISGLQAITLTESYAENRGDHDAEIQMQFQKSVTKSVNWQHNVGVSAGVTTSFQTGVPFIAEGKIEVSVEAEYGYTWGETEEETYTVSSTYTVTVPPKSKVRVTMEATRGICEVPFAYTQTDHLTDNTKVTINMDDGVFTGVDYYNIRHTSYEPEPIT